MRKGNVAAAFLEAGVAAINDGLHHARLAQHEQNKERKESVVPRILAVSQIKELIPQLRKSVIDWIPKPTPHCRVGKWKQVLKNKFVYLTQFSNQGCRQQFWKIDLEKAAQQTVKETCPQWKVGSNHADRATYDKIQEELAKLSRRNPRQDWLFEKAYCWLKSSSPEMRNAVWYPQQAIQVAHALFVSTGKFVSFKKYLNHKSRRRQSPIDKLLEAYELLLVASPTGS